MILMLQWFPCSFKNSITPKHICSSTIKNMQKEKQQFKNHSRNQTSATASISSLYDTTVNRRGLSNEAGLDLLPKKTKVLVVHFTVKGV